VRLNARRWGRSLCDLRFDLADLASEFVGELRPAATVWRRSRGRWTSATIRIGLLADQRQVLIAAVVGVVRHRRVIASNAANQARAAPRLAQPAPPW
jgi:hypothetical protein